MILHLYNNAKEKVWNHLKWTRQSTSWNLLAHGQLRLGNPLSPDQNSLATGNGNPRTLISHWQTLSYNKYCIKYNSPGSRQGFELTT
jgi:hypothetical protein